ncbi:hypothetical protein LshimejAT787_1802550 [Lyophyllum shimeji]|uniref:Uncharacterized protein n=1 Tax=Lyophyllum shimeji TaxID=47721 RepID=A0A9P3UTT3_LYOSH|nr:hypothetical protein LshimejAT787_1802550 [Lyophyllum shimeji]
MAVKRKFDVEASDDVAPSNAKQLKLIPFPNIDSDDDFHIVKWLELPLTNSPAYPTFDLYPLPFFNAEGSVNTNSHNYAHYATQTPTTPPIGLLQPSNSLIHHGSGCSQVPKLRVACAPGLNGQRTMWSFCEQCGAISMVEHD